MGTQIPGGQQSIASTTTRVRSVTTGQLAELVSVLLDAK